MGFSRQEYWNVLPFPSPGDLPEPGIEPGSPALLADSLSSEPLGKSHYLPEFLRILLPGASESKVLNLIAPRVQKQTLVLRSSHGWKGTTRCLGGSSEKALNRVNQAFWDALLKWLQLGRRNPKAWDGEKKQRPRWRDLETAHTHRPGVWKCTLSTPISFHQLVAGRFMLQVPWRKGLCFNFPCISSAWHVGLLSVGWTAFN